MFKGRQDVYAHRQEDPDGGVKYGPGQQEATNSNETIASRFMDRLLLPPVPYLGY